MSDTQIKRTKRRSAVEPKIGHLKEDNRMRRNYLKGLIGDDINAILAGAASNMKKLLNLITEQILFMLTKLLWWRKLSANCATRAETVSSQERFSTKQLNESAQKS